MRLAINRFMSAIGDGGGGEPEVIIEGPEGEEVEETETLEVEDETPAVTTASTPAALTDEAVLAHLRSNPELQKAVAKAVTVETRPAPEVDDDPKPDWDNDNERYPDNDSWSQYQEDLTDWKIRQAIKAAAGPVQAIQAQTAPIIQKETAVRVAKRISEELGVDEAGHGWLQETLATMPAPIQENLSAESKRVFALAARGFADEQRETAAKAGRSNGRASHAEPVAGVGPTRIQLADGISRNDFNVWCELTGKDMRNKTHQKEARDKGYIK